jgi:hypothetical protein
MASPRHLKVPHPTALWENEASTPSEGHRCFTIFLANTRAISGIGWVGSGARRGLRGAKLHAQASSFASCEALGVVWLPLGFGVSAAGRLNGARTACGD